MSGYRYRATREERAAAALLREKGWQVSEPVCPDCHGWGYITESTSWGTAEFGGATASTKPCPRGCVLVSWFFGTSTNVATIDSRGVS